MTYQKNSTDRALTLVELMRSHVAAQDARPNDRELLREIELKILNHVDFIPGGTAFEFAVIG